MKVKDLLKQIEYIEYVGDSNVDFKYLSIDSENILDDTLYICINGTYTDGHDYIPLALNRGANVFVVERKVNLDINQIIVKNARKVMGQIASYFYGNPEKQLKFIGVIGTNGKTTTSTIIKRILDNSNIESGLIGTLGIFYKDKFIEPTLTTPDPIYLFKILKDMVDAGISVVVMEVSAHAIQLKKVDNIKFHIGVFTNFSQDHLDFFNNMDNYKRVKFSFFTNQKCKLIVSNSDDSLGKEIIEKCSNVISYGIDNPCDIFAMEITEKDFKNSFILNIFDCVHKIDLNLAGRFNIYNALGAATASALIGVPINTIIETLNNLSCVSGRLEKVYDKDFSIFVDYAHTPDGLKKSIKALKKCCKNRLITVFGCGGNRDKDKRAKMGEISGKYSDFTVITTDNPRYEEPIDIIKDVEKGIEKITKKFVSIEDRVNGIKYAIDMAKKGDIILIAGKGEENYQEILGIKYQYNDKDTINNILNGVNI